MHSLKILVLALSLSGLCLVSTTASAQGFDIGAAMDNKRSHTNSKRTRLNTALAPFYRGSLTTPTVLKPEIEVSGDRVKAIYPVRLTIQRAKYKVAIGRLMKVLDSIGKRAQKTFVHACGFQGCEEKTHRENNVGRIIRSYNLSNLHNAAPKGHMRFYVSTGTTPQSVQAWDVPKADIDMATLEKHLLATHAPMQLTVMLGTGDFQSRRKRTSASAPPVKPATNDQQIEIVSRQSVDVGISKRSNRAVNGATLSSDFVFVSPAPHFSGNFSVTWELNRPVVVRVPFTLEAAEARTVKGARAIVRAKHQYRGRTRKVR